MAGMAFGFDPTRPPGDRVGKQLVKVRGEYIDMEKVSFNIFVNVNRLNIVKAFIFLA